MRLTIYGRSANDHMIATASAADSSAMPASVAPQAANAEGALGPILAQTSALRKSTPPIAYDFTRLIFIRSGSALLLSEFGQSRATLGDVVVLARNTLCAGEPEEQVTVTTVYLDPDYVVDQVFWHYVSVLPDRQHAQQFVERFYAEPAQLIRLGEKRAGTLMSRLDELVALSVEGRPVENFHRVQALWLSIASALNPFVDKTSIGESSTQRAATRPARPLSPLRTEAREASELLKADPKRRWSVSDLANEVHLSKSHLCRVFVRAYGKSPIAYSAMVRVEQMAHLLHTTDMPISVIAREVGWRDPDFAARQFRRNVGVTPSRYRALGRGQSKRASR